MRILLSILFLGASFYLGAQEAPSSYCPKGDVVIISEIKANFVGIDQVAKRVSACTYEIQ
mgnify:CR=1 FL=1